MPNIINEFERGLDIIKPDWWIVFATQGELIECVRSCTDGHSGTVQAKLKLRRQVIDRLTDVLRGGLECGIVKVAERSHAEG